MPASPPAALLAYMDGLRSHDVGVIGRALSDTVRFVTPVRAMDKAQTLAFLAALYVGFPDWHYDNDAPVPDPDGSWAVRWRQGGTHTGTLVFAGFPSVPPTHRRVLIPEHDFRYRIGQNGLVEIRPDPVPGGAPRGIFEQIGVALPPL
jgi:hypothetical protein